MLHARRWVVGTSTYALRDSLATGRTWKTNAVRWELWGGHSESHVSPPDQPAQLAGLVCTSEFFSRGRSPCRRAAEPRVTFPTRLLTKPLAAWRPRPKHAAAKKSTRSRNPASYSGYRPTIRHRAPFFPLFTNEMERRLSKALVSSPHKTLNFIA